MLSFEELTGKIWWNRNFVEWQNAKVHISTHSLHYAGAVFEGIRIYNTKPFKQFEHYERLLKSAEAMGYSIEYTPEELCEITNQLIKFNKLQFGYIRPFAWRGGETSHMRGVECKIHTAIIAYDPFTNKEKPNTAVKLEIAKWKKIPANSVPFHSKASGLYMMATIIQNEAVKNGFDDAVVLDQDGYLTEATTSNFFFIKNNILHTPIADTFLNGLTRQTIINEVAKPLNLQVIEGKFRVSALHGSQAAFLTGTAAGILKITSVYDHETQKTFTFSTTDNILEDIITAYNQLVGA